MINGQVKFEILFSINQIKDLLRTAYNEYEISKDEREKIMGKLGEVKQILLSDITFKQTYKKEYSERTRITLIR